MANSTTQFGGFLTNIGIAQQANNAALGLPWNITHMLIGDAGGEPSQTPDPTPNPAQTALVRQVYRAQLNAIYPSPADPAVLVAELVLPPEIGGWWIRELALEDGNGNFIAVAKPAPSYKPLLAQGSGRTQTIRMHVVFGNAANVTLKIDPSIVLATRDYVDKAREAAELYARNQLKAHTDAVNPHPQYLRRADMAKDGGPLAWLGDAAGTANALVLTLKNSEAALTAYAAGQRFQFKATAGNTGAVTARINGLAAVAVKKAGSNGLEDLVSGDIRVGGLYDLNFDGSSFQLGGGVGGGKAFERFSFEASVGQTVFTVPHSVGNTIVIRNGREVTDYVADGQKITLRTPCALGESIEILTFSAFQVSNGYTKAETDALLKTASALPVGTMLPFPKGTVPAGFLEVDGSAQSAAVYPDLAAYLGSTFNKGDEPAGFFRLPDTRGEFLRGWDHGRGIDPNRAVGSWAGDSLLDHYHAVLSSETGSGRMPFDANVAGNASTHLGATHKTAGSSVLLATLGSNVFAPAAAKGGTETRPRSVAVMWCIKAWNAPVNQGQIDIAALVDELSNLRSSMPVGAVVPFPKTTPPPGYLELDGSVQSITTYPDLAAYLGTTYNKGDEAVGFFRLPDTRGEFLRGWDHGRGVDTGRMLGGYQEDCFETHNHFLPTSTGAPGTAVSIPDTSFSLNTLANPHASSNPNGLATTYPSKKADYNTGVTLPYQNGEFGKFGSETRPRNLAVMWCIKAWNAPVNQGSIDVAALAATVVQATEAKLGTARIATQEQMSAGDSDEVIVTPKKLRVGWSSLLADNGYIALPTWLGGLILQWGRALGVPQAADAANAVGPTMDIPLPLTFPTAAWRVFATMNFTTMSTKSSYAPGATIVSNSVIRVQNNYTSSGGQICYFVIGK